MYVHRYTNNFCQELVDIAQKRYVQEYPIKEFEFSLNQLNSFCRNVLTINTTSNVIVCNHNTFDVLLPPMSPIVKKLSADPNSYTYIYMTTAIIPTAKLPDNIIFYASLDEAEIIKFNFAKLKF